MAKAKTVFFCTECGNETPNGKAAVLPAVRGTPFKSTQKNPALLSKPALASRVGHHKSSLRSPAPTRSAFLPVSVNLIVFLAEALYQAPWSL